MKKLPFSIYKLSEDEKLILAKIISKNKINKFIYHKLGSKYEFLCPNCMKIEIMTFKEFNKYRKIGLCSNCHCELGGSTKLTPTINSFGKIKIDQCTYGYSMTFNITFKGIKNIKADCIYFDCDADKKYYKKGVRWNLGGFLSVDKNAGWKLCNRQYSYYGSVENGMYDLSKHKFLTKREYLENYEYKNLLKSNQIYIAKNNNISHRMLDNMIKFNINYYDQLIENMNFIKWSHITNFDNIHNSHVLKYLNENMISYRDYEDYIYQCKILSINNKYPINFVQEHSKASKRIREYSDEELSIRLDNLISINLTELAKMSFQTGNYEITPIRNCEEIKVIGEELNNCIYDYKEKYAKGKCSLFVVKSKDKIECAIEVKQNLIQQARIKNNKDPKGNILMIIKKWCEKNDLVY